MYHCPDPLVVLCHILNGWCLCSGVPDFHPEIGNAFAGTSLAELVNDSTCGSCKSKQKDIW